MSLHLHIYFIGIFSNLKKASADVLVTNFQVVVKLKQEIECSHVSEVIFITTEVL